MTTSYSASLNSYCNVGPLVFIPGVNNDLSGNGADSSNCLQNYPFTDLDAAIMMYQSLTAPGKTLTDGTAIPTKTIEIKNNVYSTGHVFTSPVTIADGSSNPAMLSTCDYVQEIILTWADHPAISDIEMLGHKIKDVDNLSFSGSSLKLDNSGNYLVVDGSGIFFPDGPSTAIRHEYKQSMSFNDAGEISFIPSTIDGSGVYQACTYGARLDKFSLLHGSFVFAEPALTLIHGSCTASKITYSMASGKLPSIQSFPLVELSKTNTTKNLVINGENVHSLESIEFEGQPIKQGFSYTLLLKNVDAAEMIYLSNQEFLINGGSSCCVQSVPCAFAPSTYCLVLVSQAPSLLEINPNPFVVDFKCLNSNSMGVV